VLLESRANPIFAQRRVGRHQRGFTCYKLRTMRPDTREAATHEVSQAAVTRVGRFLRRTKLDELPQLWNVLRGEMSLVGPRPCLPSQHELIAKRQELGVYALRPGITGPAQVQGIDMSNPQRLALVDQQYLRQSSVRGDLALILRTLFGGGHGDFVRA
jgi:lipopolysaccharide/colanic/teichoic acid biosynthesis glycosyltransferase